MDVDLQACLDGDPSAWGAFVDRSTGLLRAAIRRSMRGRAAPVEVEDLVQEVFTRLVRDECRLLRSYDPTRASLSTWLTLVARSVTIDRLRRRRIQPLALAGWDGPDPAPDPAAGGAAEAIPLHLLTPRQRLVLRLLFDRDLTVADAATVLGVDEQTVRSTKHKALARLREHFAEAESTGGDATPPSTV